jgi:hypothetical protein
MAATLVNNADSGRRPRVIYGYPARADVKDSVSPHYQASARARKSVLRPGRLPILIVRCSRALSELSLFSVVLYSIALQRADEGIRSMGARTLTNPSHARREPTLFDLPCIPRATTPSQLSGSSPRPRPARRRLSSTDEHPDAGQRFDVFFTHEQMIALNAVALLAYERWGVRVNKSQLLRALVGALEASRHDLQQLVETMPVSPLPSAPAKAADADVHRRFELKLTELIRSAIRRDHA